MNYIKTHKTFVLLILIFIGIFVAMLFAPTRNYGDGGEYYMMLQSFYDHQSPNQTEEDAKTLANLAEKSELSKVFFQDGRMSGYFESHDGKFYSYHFWLYSLLNLPIKNILHLFRMDEMKVFQLTNAVLFIILIFAAYKLLKDKNKLLKILLIVINIAIWYVHWNHPEYFCFALVIISLLLFEKKKYSPAIFLGAVASTQNPPIIFLTGFYALYLFGEQFKNKSTHSALNLSKNNELNENRFILLKNISVSIFKIIISSFISLLPYIFYYVNFGALNLIQKTGGSNFNLISFRRVFEFLFEPNIGVFFYQPILLGSALFFIGFSFYKLSKKHKEIYLKTALLFLVMIAMLALSSSTLNWNSASAGPSRYTVWAILPIIIFINIIWLDKLKGEDLKFMKFLTLINLCYNLIILFLGGYLIMPIIANGNFGNLKLNIFSQIILNITPQFYNPTPEIFLERTQGSEEPYSKPVIYKVGGECKKALIKLGDDELLKTQCSRELHVDMCDAGYCYISW